MKKLIHLIKILPLLLIANTAIAQSIDCFIIDNPTNNSFDVYAVARGGDFRDPTPPAVNEYWADMVVTFSIPTGNPDLGAASSTRPPNLPFPLNTYDANNAKLALQTTFTGSGRKYFAYAFAGLVANFSANWSFLGNEYSLPENTPVFMCSIPYNGNTFSDIGIVQKLSGSSAPEVVTANASYYQEITNLDKTGVVYKHDIIHFNNRLNQPPVTPQPVIWRGGSHTNGEATLADDTRNFTIFEGPVIKSVIGAVENTDFLEETKIIVEPSAGFKTTTINTITGTDSIVVLADNTGYGQYIGPSIPGRIQQYVGTTEGWRNVSFPIVPASTTNSGLSFGGAPINFNTSSTSYHTSPTTRDVCGDFGDWINNVNVYQFTGAAGSPQPHEWYGASDASFGGNKGYSIFLGGTNFTTNGGVSVRGQFLDPSNVGNFSYAHAAPHGANTNGASQGIYAWEPSCGTLEEQAQYRKANWDGWALVANPFPCGLDVDQFASDNGIPASNVRVWSRGQAFGINSPLGIDYQYLSMEGKVIPPMQSFFVKLGNPVTDPTKNLAFLDAHRAFSSEDYLKTTPEEVYLMAINNADSAINHTVLAFDPLATKNYDLAYDSYVLSQPGATKPQIGFENYYSVNGSQIAAPLYVSTVNTPIAPESYPLMFWSRSSGNYSFFLDQDRLNPNWIVYVEDTKVAPGTFVNITNQSYSFSYLTSDSPQRFILHFGNSSFGIDDNTSAAWNAESWFNASNELVVSLLGNKLPASAKVVVRDVAGKELYNSGSESTHSEIVISNNFAAGMYMITVDGNDGEQRVLKVVKGN